MHDFPLSLINHGFKFQSSVCNVFHNLTIFCLNISDISIITVEDVDYRCIIHSINKPEAINLLKILYLMIVTLYKKCISKKPILKIESKTIILII